VVNGLSLATAWQNQPPRLLWRQPCGGGWAGFAVAGNVAVTIEQRGENEAVVCYDRATGRERWGYSYPALFHRSEPMGGDGPRATPTIADGNVYSVGALGHFACLDGQTGKPRWTVNILEDNQAKNTEWAMTGSPLIIGDLVVVNPGIDLDRKAGMCLAAYDRQTGKKVWAAGNRPAGYSSPCLINLAGMPQIVLFDAAGLAGFDPQNGMELWGFGWETMMGMNIVQPLLVGEDQLLISSEMSNGSVVLRIKREGEKFSAEEVWRYPQFASKFSNPVYADGRIYGLSYGIMTCLDAATGKRLWKGDRYGHGQVLLIGDTILVLSETGDVALVAADPAGFRELARIPVFNGKTWNTPAIAGNQLFIRTHTEMACFELPVR
jgi:outer membrane protein assembly factor BamB